MVPQQRGEGRGDHVIPHCSGGSRERASRSCFAKTSMRQTLAPRPAPNSGFNCPEAGQNLCNPMNPGARTNREIIWPFTGFVAGLTLGLAFAFFRSPASAAKPSVGVLRGYPAGGE